MDTVKYLDKKGLNTLIELIVNDTPSIDVPIHEDGDDIEVLNMLSELEFTSPLSNEKGVIFVDSEDNIITV